MCLVPAPTLSPPPPPLPPLPSAVMVLGPRSPYDSLVLQLLPGCFLCLENFFPLPTWLTCTHPHSPSFPVTFSEHRGSPSGPLSPMPWTPMLCPHGTGFPVPTETALSWQGLLTHWPPPSRLWATRLRPWPPPPVQVSGLDLATLDGCGQMYKQTQGHGHLGAHTETHELIHRPCTETPT